MTRDVKLVYMDLCALKRPLDEAREGRVLLEADATIAIILAAEQGRLRLVRSPALEAENDRNPDAIRRARAHAVMATWQDRVSITPHASIRAMDLVRAGLHPADALHVALAEAAGADVFLTVDRELERKARKAAVAVRVTNPIIFAAEVSHEEH